MATKISVAQTAQAMIGTAAGGESPKASIHDAELAAIPVYRHISYTEIFVFRLPTQIFPFDLNRKHSK